MTLNARMWACAARRLLEWPTFSAAFLAVAMIAGPTPALASETIGYSYDTLGRLVKVTHSGTVNSGVSACYDYDVADNRTNVTVSSSSDCVLPQIVSFSVNDVSAVEGGNLVFTVTRTGSPSGTMTVTYATSDGTAAAGADYTAKSGTLTFLAADPNTKTLSVPVIDDGITEGSETMFLNLSSPTGGAAIADSQGVGTIIDNNCAGVSFTVASNGAVTEGANSAFTVTKTGTTNSSCSVSYATASGSSNDPEMNATSGSDFTATSGTLTFTSSQYSKTVNVPTIDDTVVEPYGEGFSLTLSNPTGGSTLGTSSAAVGTIYDNDFCRGITFTLSNAGAVTEGAGSTFTIAKSGATSYSCSVNYATANGTAVAPGDYTAISGTATFAPTTTSMAVIVPTNTDTLAEGAETFSMRLSAPTQSATIGTPSSVTATINNGSSSGTCIGVSFAVSDASVGEGNVLGFAVTKSGTTSSSCSVAYASADGTAGAGVDYTAESGTLVFGSGVTSLSVTVPTFDNNADKGTSVYMYLNLSNPTTGAGISDAQGIGTINGSYVCYTCRQSVDPVSIEPLTTTSPSQTTSTDPPATSE